MVAQKSCDGADGGIYKKGSIARDAALLNQAIATQQRVRMNPLTNDDSCSDHRQHLTTHQCSVIRTIEANFLDLNFEFLGPGSFIRAFKLRS